MARQKNSDIIWLKLDMTALPFENEFDFVICGLDSINHLEDKAEIEAAFNGIYKSLKPGGIFAADMNTVYKHEQILGNNAYTFDYEGLYCGWQNEYAQDDPLHRTDIFLDFFSEESDGRYKRFREFITEIALPIREVEEMLKNSGFEICEISEYPTGSKKNLEDNEKFTFAVRKPL